MQYEFDFSFLLSAWPRLLHGVWLTIQLSLLATVLGIVIGIFCAIAKRSEYKCLNRLASIYVELIRNTPLLTQIFIVYFGFASIGLKLSAEFSAVLALTINIGAYCGEIVRAGMDSIVKGQLEAADCLGLTKMQTYWHVILLPAIEKVYPALSSQFVLLMLASSITSQISAEELTAVANLVQSETFRSFEVYMVIAVLYILLSLLFRILFWLIGLALFTRKRVLGTGL